MESSSSLHSCSSIPPPRLLGTWQNTLPLGDYKRKDHRRKRKPLESRHLESGASLLCCGGLNTMLSGDEPPQPGACHSFPVLRVPTHENLRSEVLGATGLGHNCLCIHFPRGKATWGSGAYRISLPPPSGVQAQSQRGAHRNSADRDLPLRTLTCGLACSLVCVKTFPPLRLSFPICQMRPITCSHVIVGEKIM